MYYNFIERVIWVATYKLSCFVMVIMYLLFVDIDQSHIWHRTALFICFMFLPQELLIIFCWYWLTWIASTQLMFRLDSWEAASLDSEQKEGAPCSTSRPRCDWFDGWMWTSRCNNMSISVLHCLALSHHCVRSEPTASLLCVQAICSQKKQDSKKKRSMCFLSLSTCPSTE